jgi:hypothetical protein
MIKLKEILTEAEVSRELWYHINNNISLEECVFRYGSPKYFTIINEARLLQCEQNIDFDNQTRALLETDLGRFATYKGEEVALDFPMINEEKKLTYNDFVRMVRNDNPKARNAFAKRHRCTTATDKTTARYWSCRLPRYAKQLGIAASNPGGFW